MGFFKKIVAGLQKTKASMMKQVESVFKSFSKVDEELFEELEEILITADVGVATSTKICDQLREEVKRQKITDPMQVKELLKGIIEGILGEDQPLTFSSSPSVILVIGVNGVGKTTTIGKLAALLHAEGKKVLLAAADTFRAAAIEQLQIWADRAGADPIRHAEGADPAAVVYDAISAAKARKSDVVICDTAGRLHNKKNLMDELAKISRVIHREMGEGADIETFLVLDATTGQNGVSQAKLFKEAAGITGIVLTKLDGTAKGGVVISIKDELGIPIRYIGVGEKIDDLQPFQAGEFVEALFAGEEEI